MTNRARKHHFVPVFYTKCWAGSDGQLERYTKYSDVVRRRVHPTRVGWQQGLYDIPTRGDEPAESLEERFFRQVDNVAARALRKMNVTPMFPLTAEETSGWSIFIMSLLHRTPEGLRATKAAGRRVSDETLEELREIYPTLRRSTDPSTFDEYVRTRTSLDAERTLLENLPALITNPRIGQFLNTLHWLARDIPDNQPDLLFSDDSLARTNGLQTPQGHIAMPLSPRRLLLAAWRRDTADWFDRAPVRELVRNMNKWTVESARHFVVARNSNQDTFIRRHFGADLKKPLNDGV